MAITVEELSKSFGRDLSLSGNEDVVNKVVEPLTDPDNNRSIVIPIKEPKIWAMYKKAQGLMWNADELTFEKDPTDWQKLTADERTPIKAALCFFAASDILVAKNLVENFISEIELFEAKTFYALQCHMENVHSETYGQMINVLLSDSEQTLIQAALAGSDSVAKKARWAEKWMSRDQSFGERLLAFAIIEGIFFSGSFCLIFWIKERNLLPGLTLANEFINRDENLHVEFGCMLFNEYIRNRPTTKRIREIMNEAIAIEKEFVQDAVPCQLMGMSAEKMSNYIEYCGNMLLNKIGEDAIFDCRENPCPFMDQMSFQTKTNFFEHRVAEYRDDVKFDDDMFDL